MFALSISTGVAQFSIVVAEGPMRRITIPDILLNLRQKGFSASVFALAMR